MDKELVDIMDLLKDKDVKIKNLLVKVCDTDTNREGWISFEQLINHFEEILKELHK